VLTIHTAGDAAPVCYGGGEIPPDAVWLDLLAPDETERRLVEAHTGLRLPSRAEIEGIALSGRNRGDEEVLRLHMTLFAEDGDRPPPLGLLLTPALMVSLRYAQSQAVTAAAEALREERPPTGTDALIALVETLVEHTASRMQDIAAEMAHLSSRLFVRTRLRTQLLRELMIEVGRLEGRLTRIRASLLGLNRMLVFLCDREVPWLDAGARTQLRILSSDVSALDEFDQQLTDKMQFQLDAILGFINTDQNDVMKVLTVVSAASIPPVILVGVWGMNFKHMPELERPWGYPMAIGAVVLSALVPMLVFGLRGWLSGSGAGERPKKPPRRQ
jgi:magnesium transporter